MEVDGSDFSLSLVMSSRAQTLSLLYPAIFHILIFHLHTCCLMVSRWFPKPKLHDLTQPCSRQKYEVGTKGSIL